MINSISEAIMDEDLEKPDIGRQARFKGFRDLASIDAFVETLDGENLLRIDSVSLLGAAMGAIR